MTFDICQSILAPGGHLANVGVHGKPAELHLEKLWDRNITLTTRVVDTVTTPMLLKVVQSGKLHLSEAIEPRRDDAKREVWMHGRFTYMLYRRAKG